MTDEDTESNVLVCLRVTGQAPLVPSYFGVCARCGATVWRSASSIGFRGEVICLEHLLADIAEVDPSAGEQLTITVAPWVAGDIAALASPARPCLVRSSVTDAACVLPEGHCQDSPLRFHRYPARA